MSDLLQKIENVRSLEELSSVLSALVSVTDALREAARTDAGQFIEAAHYLDRTRQVLRELVRTELLARGMNRDLADRFATAESMLRRISDDILQTMRERGR